MLQMAPTLGILSTLRSNPELPFGGQTEPFAELISAARARGCKAFVFCLEDIRWDHQKMNGFIPTKDTQVWKQLEFDFPTVIYNRLPNRAVEQRPEYQDTLGRLKKSYKARLFNPFFLNKLEIHSVLADHPKAAQWLPETTKCSINTLESMLTKHTSIYLKPAENSLGRGIYRISYNKTLDVVTCVGSDRNVTTSTFADFLQDWPTLPFSDKPYLIQQAIALAELCGQPFDFRVLYQKDKNGLWNKTGFAARIAGSGSITTHVLYGGTRFAGTKILRTVFPQTTVRDINKKISQVGKIVPPIIESAYSTNFAEFEMDIGVDAAGMPWIFELNSKPFKFDEPIIRTKSLARLLDYILFLAANPNQ